MRSKNKNPQMELPIMRNKFDEWSDETSKWENGSEIRSGDKNSDCTNW